MARLRYFPGDDFAHVFNKRLAGGNVLHGENALAMHVRAANLNATGLSGRFFRHSKKFGIVNSYGCACVCAREKRDCSQMKTLVIAEKPSVAQDIVRALTPVSYTHLDVYKRQALGNATLIKEMVRNLVDNAINYTPSSQEKPGVITARVLVDPFGRTLVLQVEDSGPGIPLAERDLVFQPFYRALGTEADGSGLGLSLIHI